MRTPCYFFLDFKFQYDLLNLQSTLLEFPVDIRHFQINLSSQFESVNYIYHLNIPLYHLDAKRVSDKGQIKQEGDSGHPKTMWQVNILKEENYDILIGCPSQF